MRNYLSELNAYSLFLFQSFFITAGELPTSVRLSTHELPPY